MINGGTLQIAADANLGAAAGDVTLDGGTLATSANLTSARDIVHGGSGHDLDRERTPTFTLNGLLSGTGALTKAGAGTLLLTGDNSGFTGSTPVAAAHSPSTAACAATSTCGAGGRLKAQAGHGLHHVNAGTVAPGNSIGTLTVAGDYTGNGGTLEIEAELGGDASPTDRLVVTGDTVGQQPRSP